MIKHKQQQASCPSGESGFTIIESLVALLVAAILLSAIAPAIILSVATRVQARRVELGTQAARAYIDGVRSGAIPPPNYAITLNEVNSSTKAFVPKRRDFAGVAAPTSLPSCSSPTNGYCTNTTSSTLYCVDRDGGGCTSNSVQDLVVQAFRSSITTNDADKGYLLGVRVYRTDAFNGKSLKTMNANNAKQATFTGGLGDRQAPLLEITTEVASKNTKFQDYCARFGGCQ